MKTRTFNSLALGSLLACSQQLPAQVLPDATNVVQDAVHGIVERQVEQAQSAALDRVVDQAEAAAAGQALERAEALQTELVQNRAEEQLLNRVERVQLNAGGVATSAIEHMENQLPDLPVQAPLDAVHTAVPFIEIALAPHVRAVAFEWVMIVSPAERARLDKEAPELLAYLTASAPLAFDGGAELLTFTVPPDLDAESAILNLVPANLRHRIDRNHIYESEASRLAR